MTDIAKMIDHTLLKPDSTKEMIEEICKEAMDYKFATVCIPPSWVKTANKMLKDSDVGITTVIGFPHGVTRTVTKVVETRDSIAAGATEIDMVINIGYLKSGNNEAVQTDIARVKEATQNNAILKVIIETGYLTDEEKVTACQLAKKAGADFVKTSTGFGPGAATVSDIELMRKTVGPDLGVKASGGVRDLATAEAMINAGATRIGASSGIAIVSGSKGDSDY